MTHTQPKHTTDRQRALAILKRHGLHATSFQLLEQGMSYWFDDAADAFIGFVREGSRRLVAGPPVAAPEEVGEVVRRFVADCAREGERALIFSADRALLEALERTPGLPRFDHIKIGEQPEWCPGDYTTKGAARRTLRSQVNRARNKEVATRRVHPAELRGPLRDEIEAVIAEWQQARKMSVMGFMVAVQPFAYAEERRIYVAEDGDGRVVAFLGAVPVYARQGWFFEDVLRHPEAPNGTTELLIDTAMRDVAQDGAAYATLGLSPLSGLDASPGRHRLKRRFLVWCYEELGALYGFVGLRRFKERFHPDRWSPQYLVSIPGDVGVMAFGAALRAFANDNLVTFGLDTARRMALRAPRWCWVGLTFGLGALLGAWTLLLAAAPTGWFGAPPLQWAWVAFDASIAAALLLLSWRVWRGGAAEGVRRLSRPLALVTALNLVLTALHVGWLHHDLVGWTMAAGVFVALLGPLLTAVVLGALDRAAPEMPQHHHA